MPVPISRENVETYRALKADALRQVRTFNLSDASYEQMWDALQRLERFINEARGAQGPGVTRDQLEAQFDEAALAAFGRKGVAAGTATISGLLEIAARRETILRDDFFGSLAKLGAKIEKFQGVFLPTPRAGRTPPAPAGDSPRDVRTAPKTSQLIQMLINKGLAADLVIHPSVLPSGTWRTAPYTLIEIPRYGVEIAVCDQLGEGCFVSRRPLGVAAWSAQSKEEMRETAGVTRFNYSGEGHWLRNVAAVIDKFGPPPPPPAGTGPLTAAQVAQWIRDTHEKWMDDPDLAGGWPSAASRVPRLGTVWQKNEDGTFSVVEGESWRNLEYALRNGRRGLTDAEGKPLASTLAGFRDKHGLNDNLTEAEIVQWIKDTREARYAEGIRGVELYPASNDTKGGVLQKTPDGAFAAVNKTRSVSWAAIHLALKKGGRGLKNEDGSLVADSLYALRVKHGLVDNFDPATIEKWIIDTTEKTGRSPNVKSTEIWSKDAKGVFTLIEGETWRGIDSAFKLGHRGLRSPDNTPIAGSLADFKRMMVEQGKLAPDPSSRRPPKAADQTLKSRRRPGDDPA